MNPILNGREAEMADKDGTSSDDEKDAKHKFAHPDHFKQVLKSKYYYFLSMISWTGSCSLTELQDHD